MGKRSNFERIDKDFYRTIDPRAVEPLLPFLSPKTNFAEPCAGAGDLIKQLQTHGHSCVWASDIDEDTQYTLADGLSLTPSHLREASCIITNPPWSRPVLHKMIEHFVTLAPTWLLFDSDWCYTRQSSAYMKYCTDIVAIGRLKWIPNTTMVGKDNCSWYRFEKDKHAGTQFHGR